jgi:CheY-like chemotaxis protein
LGEIAHNTQIIVKQKLNSLFTAMARVRILATELHSTIVGNREMKTSADKSILVIEDQKLLNWSLARSLAKWGFDVHPVFTAGDAMAQLEKSGFAVILLDYQLPDLDGLQLARSIRKVQPDAVIFLVTAFQLNELDVDAGLIDAYFNKPVDFQQLHQALVSIPRWLTDPGKAGGGRPRVSRKS